MKQLLIAAAACILVLAGCRDRLPTDNNPPVQNGPGTIYYSLNWSADPSQPTGHFSIDPLGQNKASMGIGSLYSAPAHGIMAYNSADQTGIVSNVDGSNPHQAVGVVKGIRPILSPDASQIAYTIEGDSLIVVDVNGTHVRTVGYGVARGTTPAFSPDGSQLAYIGKGNGYLKVHVLRGIRAGEVSQDQVVASNALTHFLFDGDAGISWSPDGKRIAYSGASVDSSDIFVVNADGTGQIDVTNDPGDAIMPTWSPDGKSIAYVRVGGDFIGHVSADIWITKDDGLTLESVTDTPGFDQIEIYPSWSPDGKSLAYGVLEPYTPFQQYNVHHRLDVIDLTTHAVRTVEPMGIDGFAFWIQ